MNDQKNTICIECKCRRYLSYKKQLAMELPPITCNKYRSLRQYRKKFTNHLNLKYTFTLIKQIESHSRK